MWPQQTGRTVKTTSERPAMSTAAPTCCCQEFWVGSGVSEPRVAITVSPTLCVIQVAPSP